MKTGAMTRGNEILNVNKYLLFGFFLGENLFEEKVLPKPLSKTFLDCCCHLVRLIGWGGGFLKYTVEFG